MAASHLGYFRGVLSWGVVENVPGAYSFAYYDQLIAELARHHLRFLPLLYVAPPWATTAPATAAAAGFYPPANANQFASFAALCVERYGPNGAFWRSNPGVPYYPVQAWQIWNEPNLNINWEPKPDPAAYAGLLRASYRAIKRVDRHATVVTAGMPFSDQQLEISFLSKMFRSGARGAFDALAIHPYSGSVSRAIHKLQVAREVMARFGAGRQPLWVTEVSWAGGGSNAYVANQRGQAQNLVGFFDRVHADRALQVQKIFWYGWQDKVYGPDPSYWGYHLGLFTSTLRPKLALGALAKIAARYNR
ncbi:MAG: glycosyl hydrolase [Solirubrobacteraceae bacterium]